MQFDIITIFPDFFRGPLDHGIIRRAREAGLADIRVVDLREFTHDRHATVDDPTVRQTSGEAPPKK